jgi:hypothetical protein
VNTVGVNNDVLRLARGIDLILALSADRAASLGYMLVSSSVQLCRWRGSIKVEGDDLVHGWLSNHIVRRQLVGSWWW